MASKRKAPPKARRFEWCFGAPDPQAIAELQLGAALRYMIDHLDSNDDRGGAAFRLEGLVGKDQMGLAVVLDLTPGAFDEDWQFRINLSDLLTREVTPMGWMGGDDLKQRKIEARRLVIALRAIADKIEWGIGQPHASR